MRRLPLLVLRVLFHVVLVLRLHLLRRHGDLREQRIGGQDQVLELHFLGRSERGLVRLVERLHRGVVDLHVLAEARGIDRRDSHLALLLDERQETLAFRARDDAAAGDRVDHLLGEDLLADALLVPGLGDPGAREQLLVAVERKLVAVAEARVGGDPVEDLGVRHAEMEVARLLLDQPLADQLLQDVESHLRVVEHRRVDAALCTHQHFLLFAQRLRELVLRDLSAVERGDVTDACGIAEIVVDAEESERQHDEREHDLHDALVFVDDVEHAFGTCFGRRDVRTRSLARARLPE